MLVIFDGRRIFSGLIITRRGWRWLCLPTNPTAVWAVTSWQRGML